MIEVPAMNKAQSSLLIGIYAGRIYLYDFKNNELQNLLVKGESYLRWKEEDPSSISQMLEEIIDFYRVDSCENIQILLIHDCLHPEQLLSWLIVFRRAASFQTVEVQNLLMNYSLYRRWLSKKEPAVNVRFEQQTYKLIKDNLHNQYRMINASSQYDVPLEQLLKYGTTLLGEKI